ncbi:hypothetical protein [Bacillus niameyensis]|uniref:hypothetical protein n=1 Tax=Bacillus niameyensis TaxID=1522308 RepID=UPI0007826D91|nr:hypothetical protein [Bacillus niameyensis]
MIIRAILFLIGFGLTVAGGVSLIGYLNLLAMGNSFLDYISFAVKRPECYLFPIGILFIMGSLINKKPDQTLREE